MTVKVLFASHSPLLFGAELALYELVKGLKTTGLAEPMVVFPSSGPLVARVRALGVPTWVVRYGRWATSEPTPFQRLSLLGQNVVAVPAFLRLLRQTRPDLVVTNTLTIISPALAAKLAALPHLWYVHEILDLYKLSFHWGKRLSFKTMSWLSSRIVAPSHTLADQLSAWVPRAQLRVLYQSAEASDSRDLPSAKRDHFGLVMLGHKSAGKRQEDAVRAVALLRGRGVDVQLSLVGSGDADYIKHLQRLVKELSADTYVEFVDQTEDPFAYLHGANAVLTCSRHESFGRVIIEAMKSARPVVGARAAATKELIQDGLNGLLYEPGDVSDLAAKIETLYKDRDYARWLAENAKGWAEEKFTLEKYAEGFMALASEALAKR